MESIQCKTLGVLNEKTKQFTNVHLLDKAEDYELWIHSYKQGNESLQHQYALYKTELSKAIKNNELLVNQIREKDRHILRTIEIVNKITIDNEGCRENSSITNGVSLKIHFMRLHPKTMEFDYIQHIGKFHELEMQRQINKHEHELLLEKRDKIKTNLSQIILDNKLLENLIREKDQHILWLDEIVNIMGNVNEDELPPRKWKIRQSSSLRMSNKKAEVERRISLERKPYDVRILFLKTGDPLRES